MLQQLQQQQQQHQQQSAISSQPQVPSNITALLASLQNSGSSSNVQTSSGYMGLYK
jgi:hypothetical protein